MGYVACILCFLLPFLSLSCGGQKLMQLNGTQIAFGTSLDQSAQVLGSQTKQKIDGNPLATVALLCAIGGAVMSILRKGFPLATGIAGVVGALCLLLLRSAVEGQVTQRGMGVITVSYEPGYIVTLLLLLGLGGWNLWLVWAGRRKVAPAPPPHLPPPYR